MRTKVMKRLLILTACLVPVLGACGGGAGAAPHEARRQATAASAQPLFQSEFERAYRAISAPHKSKVRSPSVKAGDHYLMTCAPSHIRQQNDTLSITFGNVNAGNTYSLISIGEFNDIFVIAGTNDQAYIGDNSLQPADIKNGATAKTDPSLTYGHMDATGYPYAAFGPSGRYLVLLVNGVLEFGKHGVVKTRAGIPKVLAGCVIDWPGLK